MNRRTPRNKWRNAETPEELLTPPVPASTPTPTRRDEEARVMRDATLFMVAVALGVAGVALLLAKWLP